MKAKKKINRREFISQSAVLGLSASVIGGELAGTGAIGQTTAAKTPIDLAEWSFFWVGVERAELARGPVVNGKQMYVEYQIPAQVRHPYPIVLVHGGGGQGLDWMGSP